MNDSTLVGEGKGFGDLLDQAQAIVHRERPPRKALSEILAFEPIHGEEALTVGSLAVRNMSDDAGVAKLGQELGFAGEALHFAMSFVSMQKFEGDGVSAVTVGGAVDGAHAAAACGALDLEAIGKEAARHKL